MKKSYTGILVREYHGEEIKWQIIVHPAESNAIIINFPGFNGQIDGYNNKYGKLAEFMQENIGAVIRSGNHHYGEIDYSESIQDDLKTIIDYAIENSKAITGKEDSDIYLMGFSAGASGVAAVAHAFPQVKKILLMAPSADAGMRAVKEGLRKFKGEVYVIAGEDDEIVGPETAPQIFSFVKTKATHKLEIIKNCDHQFRGTENGIIMSKAPLWAFGEGNKDLLSLEGGIELY